MLCGNSLGVMNLAVLKVWESFPFKGNSSLLLSELILLAVACVPNVIDPKIGANPGNDEPKWPMVLIRMMRSNVQN